MSELRLRVASPDDAATVAGVYRPRVAETAVTIEETLAAAASDGDAGG